MCLNLFMISIIFWKKTINHSFWTCIISIVLQKKSQNWTKIEVLEFVLWSIKTGCNDNIVDWLHKISSLVRKPTLHMSNVYYFYLDLCVGISILRKYELYKGHSPYWLMTRCKWSKPQCWLARDILYCNPGGILVWVVLYQVGHQYYIVRGLGWVLMAGVDINLTEMYQFFLCSCHVRTS